MWRRRGFGPLATGLVTMLMLMLGTAADVSAQEAGAAAAKPRAYNPSRRVPAFFGQVGLTPSQREQIYSIRGKYYEQAAELKRQIEELEAKEDTDCAGVLTDSQRQLLDTLRTSRRGASRAATAAAPDPAPATATSTTTTTTTTAPSTPPAPGARPATRG
jgi:Spy/CpxP family protein refolding chaperone